MTRSHHKNAIHKKSPIKIKVTNKELHRVNKKVSLIHSSTALQTFDGRVAIYGVGGLSLVLLFQFHGADKLSVVAGAIVDINAGNNLGLNFANIVLNSKRMLMITCISLACVDKVIFRNSTLGSF
ncbi:hypothetical protein GQX74_005178 [Glossina fuscipes]|nr:hypothetical protein GQX74_005178 [Glossina fuscipes]